MNSKTTDLILEKNFIVHDIENKIINNINKLKHMGTSQTVAMITLSSMHHMKMDFPNQNSRKK